MGDLVREVPWLPKLHSRADDLVFVRGVLKTHVMRLDDAGGAFHIREGFGEVEFSDGAGNDEKLPDVRLEWQA